jgi:hypothetical protein
MPDDASPNTQGEDQADNEDGSDGIEHVKEHKITQGSTYTGFLKFGKKEGRGV